jgi:flagella basal body P-ring formation protein FlgA
MPRIAANYCLNSSLTARATRGKIAIMKTPLLILCLSLLTHPAWAVNQDHQAVRASVASFVEEHSGAQAKLVNYQVDELDSRLVLQACATLQAFLPTGSQLVGRTTVGVHCTAGASWTVFLPVQIKISRALLLNARQLPAGHTLQAEDVYAQTMEVTHTSGITDQNLVLGKVLRYGISAGQLLREDMLRTPFSVMQGQSVQVLVHSASFSISSTGVALNNASDGQAVKVKSVNGRVLSGVARANGMVELLP